MMKKSPNSPCPCYSGLKYKRCCRPWHLGRPAPTPEALMRSRYSAYALDDSAYIIKTTHPDGPRYVDNQDVWQSQLSSFAHGTNFEDLAILSTEMDDTPDPKRGWVTFKATLSQKTAPSQPRKDASFTERSLFKKEAGQWLYVSAAE